MLHKSLSASVTAAFYVTKIQPSRAQSHLSFLCVILSPSASVSVWVWGYWEITSFLEDRERRKQLCYCEPVIMWCVHFLIGLCPCPTCRYQRYPGDAEWHGHQRHRRNTEAVLQGAAGASAHRPPLPRLHGGHRCVTITPGSVCLSSVGHFRALNVPSWKRWGAKSCLLHNLIWHLFPLPRSALRPGRQGELHDASPALPAWPQPHDLPHSAGAPQTVHTHTHSNPQTYTETPTDHS